MWSISASEICKTKRQQEDKKAVCKSELQNVKEVATKKAKENAEDF